MTTDKILDKLGIKAIEKYGEFTIGKHPTRGFYVHRPSQAGRATGDYLHADGTWKPETCVKVGRKLVWSGYFQTQKAAKAALLTWS